MTARTTTAGWLWLWMMTGCGGAPHGPVVTTAPVAGASAASSDPAQQATAELSPQEKMWRHFDDVSEARNAVIAGKLDGIESPLQRVAAGEWGIEVPEVWNVDLDEMKAIARKAPEARSLADASKLIADLSEVCADCHRTHRGGPEVPLDRVGYPDQDTSVQATMARHAWAADELWLGLTAPSLPAWNRGVEAVEGGMFLLPGFIDEPEEGAPPPPAEDPAHEALQKELGGLRDWAQRAVQASTPRARGQLYGELLLQCADCHARKGVHPSM